MHGVEQISFGIESHIPNNLQMVFQIKYILCFKELIMHIVRANSQIRKCEKSGNTFPDLEMGPLHFF